MIFAGGIPLQRGGQVVGAVGVSGGTGAQDQAVAEAAAAAVLNRAPPFGDHSLALVLLSEPRP